jgi:hypothetical protein
MRQFADPNRNADYLTDHQSALTQPAAPRTPRDRAGRFQGNLVGLQSVLWMPLRKQLCARVVREESLAIGGAE